MFLAALSKIVLLVVVMCRLVCPVRNPPGGHTLNTDGLGCGQGFGIYEILSADMLRKHCLIESSHICRGTQHISGTPVLDKCLLNELPSGPGPNHTKVLILNIGPSKVSPSVSNSSTFLPEHLLPRSTEAVKLKMLLTNRFYKIRFSSCAPRTRTHHRRRHSGLWESLAEQALRQLETSFRKKPGTDSKNIF